MFIGFDSQEKQLVSERHIGKIHWAGVFTCRSYWSSICDYRPSYRHAAPGALWILSRSCQRTPRSTIFSQTTAAELSIDEMIYTKAPAERRCRPGDNRS